MIPEDQSPGGPIAGELMSVNHKASVAVILNLAFVCGCTKNVSSSMPKEAPPPPPPSVPAAAETRVAITDFTVEPSLITQGQSATLRWRVSENATTVTIQPIGSVDRIGTQRVSPKNSTAYRLTAMGPGGPTATSVVVRVVPAPPPPVSTSGTAVSSTGLDGRLSAALQDVYFDYDNSNLSEAARGDLQRDASALKAILADFPKAKIVLEGHSDERGSAEYNLALGDRRAVSAKEYLVQFGLSAEFLTVLSYGKEQPQCTDAIESCWHLNRRVHFTSAGQ